MREIKSFEEAYELKEELRSRLKRAFEARFGVGATFGKEILADEATQITLTEISRLEGEKGVWLRPPPKEVDLSELQVERDPDDPQRINFFAPEGSAIAKLLKDILPP